MFYFGTFFWEAYWTSGHNLYCVETIMKWNYNNNVCVCVCVCDYKRESAIQRTPLSPTRGTHSIGVVHSFPPSGDVEQSESVQQAKNKMLRSEVKARGILV